MTVADQSPPEKVAAPRESAADRSNRTVELRGGLIVCVPFEIAQDEWSAVLSRQPTQLLNELRPDPGGVIDRMMRWGLEVGDGDLPVSPPERVAPVRRATRWATPKSQLDKRLRSRIEGALRTRIKNVA